MEDMGSQFFTGFLLRETRATFGGKGGGEAREVGTGMGGRRTESEKIIETCECVKKNLLT